MKPWSLIFLLLGVSTPGWSRENSIDLLRLHEGGVLHTAVRCQKECEARQSFNGNFLSSKKFKVETIEKLLDSAFSQIPQREISQTQKPLPRIPQSPLHWRLVSSKQTVQGGFTVHSTPEAESARTPTYRSILELELRLNRLLGQSAK